MRTPQTGRESDLGLVRGAARRLGLQSAALVALAVIVLVAISTVLVLRQQNVSAEALLEQATALTRPVIAGSVTATFLNQGQSLNGSVTTAQNQVAGTIAVSLPLIAPVQWALRVQSADSKHVVELAAAARAACM